MDGIKGKDKGKMPVFLTKYCTMKMQPVLIKHYATKMYGWVEV
jgi:hypothetical protein